MILRIQINMIRTNNIRKSIFGKKKTYLRWTFSFSFTPVPFANMEVGFMNYTAVRHQETIETFWLHFCWAVRSSMFYRVIDYNSQEIYFPLQTIRKIKYQIFYSEHHLYLFNVKGSVTGRLYSGMWEKLWSARVEKNNNKLIKSKSIK